MKRKQRIIIVITTSIVLCFSLLQTTFAINTNFYEPDKLEYIEGQDFFNKTVPIIRVITNIGIASSVVALTVIGFKYMLGSLEEKAQYKQYMLPFICGCIMILFTSTLVKMIALI